jgi:hypothetical protein
VRQREVETVEFNRDQGFGITLYVGQRKGSASTSASGPEAIRETVPLPWPLPNTPPKTKFGPGRCGADGP